MNTLALHVEELTSGRQMKKEGILFSDVAVVKMFIDGEDVEASGCLGDDVLVYFDELEKSLSASGNYLIFTCVCGMAEDGGWEGVKVVLNEDVVTWEFEAGGRVLWFSFARDEYASEIKSARAMIGTTAFPLEPRKVGFPKGFQR
ncbi:hypothetical protein [Corallococcus macrosporus]|uniref:hypothetical protein n=1 Tax=Corallococcus macrosporus TaxID=35 RepID=UPI000F503BA7|nr:hypothetical protein [Corallococcus macrosporus]